MSRFLVVLALLALTGCPDRKQPTDAGAAAPAVPTGPAVGVTLAPAAVGTKWQVEHRTSLAFTSVAETDGAVQTAATSSDELARFTVEVLAADGAEVTKVKLTVDEATRRPEPGPHPLAGKSYLIEWRPASMVVTLADGNAITGPEGTLLRVYADLVRPNEVQLALARSPTPTGDAPELAKAFATMYARREGLKGGPRTQVSDVSAKLDDRGEHLELLVKFEAKVNDRKVAIVSMPRGTMELIKATGVVRAMRFEGPIEMTEGGRTTAGRLVEATTWK